MNDYVDKLWNSDAVACLDALKEADEAVETINKDMFSIVADVAADIMQENGNPSGVLKDTLKKFEQKYKKERSLKHMPGSYRSAKSTIVNAVKHGINLHDAIDGKLKGKSALEKEIKQASKPGKEQQPVTDAVPTYMELHLNKAFGELGRALATKGWEDRANAKMYVDRMREKLDFIDERLEKE